MKRKSIKKIVGILIMICIIISGMTTQSYANNLLDSSVQFDEFISRVKLLCEQYEIEIEVVESANFKPISRVELEKYLETMEKHLQNADNSSVEVVGYAEDDNLAKESDNEISPAATMPVSKRYSDIITVRGKFPTPYTPVPARVDIVYTVDTTYDANRSNFISVDGTDWYEDASMNLDDLTCTVKASASSKTVNGTVSGKAYFIYTDTKLNYTIRTTEPYSASFILYVPK